MVLATAVRRRVGHPSNQISQMHFARYELTQGPVHAGALMSRVDSIGGQNLACR
jgi:hypothetical protein